MFYNLITNSDKQPSKNEIFEFMGSDISLLWQEIERFLYENYKPKEEFFYSKCSAKRGWNIKYKKGGKSLCTMYPDDGFFYVLLVLGLSELKLIEENKKLFTKEFLDSVEQSGAMNGFKWVMPVINTQYLVEDVKRTIEYKYPIK